MFIESNQSAQTRSLRSDCHPARRNIGDRRGPRSVLGRDDKGIREKRRANGEKRHLSLVTKPVDLRHSFPVRSALQRKQETGTLLQARGPARGVPCSAPTPW